MKKRITIDEFKKEIQSSKALLFQVLDGNFLPNCYLGLLEKFLFKQKSQNGLTIVFTSSATDPGIDHLADPKLLSCSFGSYYGSIPQPATY